jgi:hypothetical protein
VATNGKEYLDIGNLLSGIEKGLLIKIKNLKYFCFSQKKGFALISDKYLSEPALKMKINN